MAFGLQNYPNVTTPDSDYPNGKSKDNTGFNDGTPVDWMTRNDHQQFFAKLFRKAEITPNGLPDNEYSGNQTYQAAEKVFDKYGSSYIVNANLNILISAPGANMFNPFVLVPSAAPTGIQILLPSIDPPKELSVLTIVNDSAFSVDIISNLFALNYVVPFPSTTYVLAAGKSIEITFITISGQYNWIISKKP